MNGSHVTGGGPAAAAGGPAAAGGSGPCPRCGQPVRAGASFCGACGTPLPNRGPRLDRGVTRNPGVTPDPGGRQAARIPGSIPVGLGEGTDMSGTLTLVPAAPGKRLGAAVLDWLAPVAILTVLMSFGFAGITSTRSAGLIIYDTSLLAILAGIGAGLALVYAFAVASVEGRSGNTIGNQFMGIRSADKDGYAPGLGAVFLRGIVTGAGILLAVLAAVLVAVFRWFDAALLILGPLLLLGTAWAVVVVLSSAWDRNGRLRGWHDRAAKTLVFDVVRGRNPVATGGIEGPYSFAPLDLPPVQQVASPVASRTPVASNTTVEPAPPAAPDATDHPVNAVHPDDAMDRTQVRAGARQDAREAVLRIRLDDGRDFRLERTVLIGRNPAPAAGESQAQLLPVPDPGRTISKTHLHLLTDGTGVWITDRHSTNGSAVTTPDGMRTALQPGVPAFVSPGTTVHFGDRTFNVGHA
ncbi:RDD family protein [Arthrobacter sp. ISL-65]|uniref:RDD family protein n=1 Tax=Arthrobacter sp. ISL-65 TaxID=2819112 RepID=UPI001BE5C816|nr:RDD family protein [Arthrobacter sp. ISL-65]